MGAVAVTRDRDGRILLLRTRQHWGWCLPGGLLRRREPPLVGLSREIAEEIGIEVAPAELVDLPQHTLIDARTQQVTLIVELMLEHEQTPVPDDVEVLETGWFHVDALPPGMVQQTIDQLRLAGVRLETDRS